MAVRCLLSRKGQGLAHLLGLRPCLLMLSIFLDDTLSSICMPSLRLHLLMVSLTSFCSWRICAEQVVTARSCASLEVLLHTDAKSADKHHGNDCQKPCCCHQSKPSVFRLSGSSGLFVLNRTFSSQAGANSGDTEDELEDGFSELDDPPEIGDKDAGFTPEDSSDEDDTDGTDLPDVKPEKKHMKKFGQSPLLNLMLDVPNGEVTEALDKWAKEGNTFDRGELYFCILNLRRRKLFGKALALLEWAEQSKLLEFGERDYASRLDLIAKVSGVNRAEQYIEKIPEPHNGEIVYRTLLANCVSEANLRKAEQVFNKMADLGFPVTVFACNQLLLLYKMMNKKKIADILAIMEKENVKPSRFTYEILVDAKGSFKDIEGMERVIETMQENGIEPDLMFQAKIARNYIFSGHREKALAILGSMAGDDIKENRSACEILLRLYGCLGKKDEVERIWKSCADNARVAECVSAIEAFGRLGDVEKAEKIFEDMNKKWKTLTSKSYNALLGVYANQNLFDKGKELVELMRENGVRIGIQTLNELVKLYIDAGEVEKGDNLLQKLSHEYKLKARKSHLMLLGAYSKKGDIHNSEKLFNILRQMGYNGSIRHYRLLLEAYLHAKRPAYGFRERMKADNVFLNSTMAPLVAATNPFNKNNSISESID